MERLRRFWHAVPFRHMTAFVIALMIVKEQFPFSNFPMYSNIDAEADVVFITDQKDQPLPMDDVFRSGSSTAKKAYKKELGRLTQRDGRDPKLATAAERKAAGAIVLHDWHASMRNKNVPSGTTALRLYRRTFALTSTGLANEAPELLAEQAL